MSAQYCSQDVDLNASHFSHLFAHKSHKLKIQQGQAANIKVVEQYLNCSQVVTACFICSFAME